MSPPQHHTPTTAPPAPTPLSADDLLALRSSGIPLSDDARSFLGLAPDDLTAAPTDPSPTTPPTHPLIYTSANGTPTGRRPPLRREVLYATLLPFARRGASAKLAAELLAQPYTSILAIYNDPAFRREALAPLSTAFNDADATYIDTRLSIVQQIERAGQLAFDTLCDILRDADAPPAVRVTAARDLLDRAPSTRAGTHSSVAVQFTSIDAAKLVEAAAAARALDSHVTPNVIPIDHTTSADAAA